MIKTFRNGHCRLIQYNSQELLDERRDLIDKVLGPDVSTEFVIHRLKTEEHPWNCSIFETKLRQISYLLGE
jgi:hypothetical protein